MVQRRRRRTAADSQDHSYYGPLLNRILEAHLAGDIETADRLRYELQSHIPGTIPLNSEPVFTRLTDEFIRENTLSPSYPPAGTHWQDHTSVPARAGSLLKFLTDYNLEAGNPDPDFLITVDEQLEQALCSNTMGMGMEEYDPKITSPQHLFNCHPYGSRYSLYAYQSGLYLRCLTGSSNLLPQPQEEHTFHAADPTIWLRSETHHWSPRPVYVSSGFQDRSIPEVWAARHTRPADPAVEGGDLHLDGAELLFSIRRVSAVGTSATLEELYQDTATKELFRRAVFTHPGVAPTEEMWDFGTVEAIPVEAHPVFFPLGVTPDGEGTR